MRMLSMILRVLLGFIVACLVAGAVTVAFVITPADIAAAPAYVRPERLGSAGILSLLAATHSAIFASPFALILVAIAEWRAIRSWLYYVIAGLAIALGGFVAEYLNEVAGQPSIVNDYALRTFLTVGFFGGLAYWLVAGRRAGGKPSDAQASEEPAETEETEETEEAEPPAKKPPKGGKLAQAAN